MKNTAVFFNALLLIAVAVLFYLHFSTRNTANTASLRSSVKLDTTGGVRLPIAYIELDSLNEKISYIKNKRKELESEQSAIDAEWENGYRNLENQKNNFLKRGSSITREEAENFQASLIQQQQSIDGKKQNQVQSLGDKSVKIMGDIQKQLQDYLAEYNKDKRFSYIFTIGNGLDYIVYKDSSLNITNDVIEGMNKKLNQSAKP